MEGMGDGMTIGIPAPVRELLTRLDAQGYAAYAVGGCVRDALLGATPQDWDICTGARPEEIRACFSSLQTILTGEKYGTVTVLYAGEPYEITTFRAETDYRDSRHPGSVSFLGELTGDLARRDFTVNAMAADCCGRVTDCFGGREDLQNRVLRCVGQAQTRFSEDALRILRALRFSSRLGFSIEEKTAQAIHACKDGLRRVAPERVRKELAGILCGQNAAAVLRDFSDVLFVLIPELAPCRGFRQYNPHHVFDVWEHTLAVVEAVEPVEALRLAALLHDIGKPAAFSMDKNLVGHFYGHACISEAMTRTILRRLRFDNATTQQVSLLVREHDCFRPEGTQRQLRRLLARLGEEKLRLVLCLQGADLLGTGTRSREQVQAILSATQTRLDELLRGKGCFGLPELRITGRELLALGVPAGPRIGRLLKRTLAAVVDGELPNEPETLVRYAQTLMENPEMD